MRDFLIALFVLAGGFGALQLVLRKSGTDKKDEVDPEAPRNVERGRAASEAAAGAPAHQPLSDADAETVAELHEYFREIGTGEQAIVTPGPPVRRHHVYRGPARWQRVAARRQSLRGFDADPLAAAIPGRHRVEEPVLWGAEVERWFSPQVAPAPMPFPELPAEPMPLPPLDFTGEFRRSDLLALFAAEAEASR